MKSKRRFLAFVLIVIYLVLLPGCWDYEEINKLALISGFAIDKDPKTNKYIMTVEIINPSTGGGGGESKIKRSLSSAKGETVFKAIRNLIPVVSKRSYWAHAKVGIISNEIASKDIVAVLDLLNRDPELRSDIHLLISRDKTAREVLEAEPTVNDLMAFQLDDTIKSNESLSEVPKGEVWRFVNDLSSDSLAPVLPAVRIRQCTGKLTPEVLGSAVFKGKKMVGWLDGKETRGMLWLKNTADKTVVALDNINNTKITIEIFGSKSKLKPLYNNGKLTMEVNFEATVDIGEVEDSFNYSDEKGQDLIKNAISTTIQSQIEAVVKKAQNEFGTDIFGFGEVIEKHYPSLWDSLKANWDSEFTTIQTQYNFKINIIGSALMAKPIKVGK